MKKAVLPALLAVFAVPTAWADDSLIDSWLAAVTATQSGQPHWVTPLVTVTPRLEQEYRFDALHEELSDGTQLDNFGNTKGLELIVPQANMEVAVNAPGYVYHPDSKRPNGYTDSSLLLKYRIAAANEDNGNYIVTAFLAESFATGSAGVGNNARIYTPTLAAGKGFGDFDIQSTLGYTMPDTNEHGIGHQTNWNTALQYHCDKHFWPEIEYNQTRYGGGEHNEKTQDFVTTGLVTKWPLHERVAAVFGLGYQQPVTTFHTYAHAVVFTARLAF